MSSKKLCKHSKLGRSIEKALYQPRTKCRFLRVQALTTINLFRNVQVGVD